MLSESWRGGGLGNGTCKDTETPVYYTKYLSEKQIINRVLFQVFSESGWKDSHIRHWVTISGRTFQSGRLGNKNGFTEWYHHKCMFINKSSFEFAILNYCMAVHKWHTYTAGNTEQGKCRLSNEYLFLLFFIGHWYYEKKIVFIKRPILAGTNW